MNKSVFIVSIAVMCLLMAAGIFALSEPNFFIEILGSHQEEGVLSFDYIIQDYNGQERIVLIDATLFDSNGNKISGMTDSVVLSGDYEYNVLMIDTLKELTGSYFLKLEVRDRESIQTISYPFTIQSSTFTGFSVEGPTEDYGGALFIGFLVLGLFIGSIVFLARHHRRIHTHHHIQTRRFIPLDLGRQY